MKVVYHPDVQRDVSTIMRYYDGINDRLGDEFWDELNSFISQAVANPTISSSGKFRRCREPGSCSRKKQSAWSGI